MQAKTRSELASFRPRCSTTRPVDWAGPLQMDLAKNGSCGDDSNLAFEYVIASMFSRAESVPMINTIDFGSLQDIVRSSFKKPLENKSP